MKALKILLLVANVALMIWLAVVPSGSENMSFGLWWPLATIIFLFWSLLVLLFKLWLKNDPDNIKTDAIVNQIKLVLKSITNSLKPVTLMYKLNISLVVGLLISFFSAKSMTMIFQIGGCVLAIYVFLVVIEFPAKKTKSEEL